MRRLRMLGRLLHRSGPYLLLELVLPGGTLFALLLFLYQHRQVQARREYAPRVSVAVTRALGIMPASACVVRSGSFRVRKLAAWSRP